MIGITLTTNTFTIVAKRKAAADDADKTRKDAEAVITTNQGGPGRGRGKKAAKTATEVNDDPVTTATFSTSGGVGGGGTQGILALLGRVMNIPGFLESPAPVSSSSVSVVTSSKSPAKTTLQSNVISYLVSMYSTLDAMSADMTNPLSAAAIGILEDTVYLDFPTIVGYFVGSEGPVSHEFFRGQMTTECPRAISDRIHAHLKTKYDEWHTMHHLP